MDVQEAEEKRGSLMRDNSKGQPVDERVLMKDAEAAEVIQDPSRLADTSSWILVTTSNAV